MDNLERWNRLNRFNAKLSDAEKEVVRLYMSVFYDKYSNGPSVYSRLFEALESNIEFANLQSEFSDDALRKNLDRLEEKVLEGMSLDVNTSRRTSFDQVDRDFLRVLTLLKHYKVLALSGNAVDTIPILRRLLKIAKRIEQFDFALFALYQLADISIMRGMTLKSLDVFHQIEKYERFRSLYGKALTTKHRLFKIYTIDSPSKKQKDWLDSLNQDLDAVTTDDAPPSALRNAYYGKLLYYDKLKDYKSCLEICESLEVLVNDNYAIRKEREVTTIRINRALFGILGYQFQESLELIEDILKADRLTDINKSFLFAQRSRIQLILGEYENCLEELLGYIHSDWFSNTYAPQVHFTAAMCHFKLEQYQDAMRVISDQPELRKDKSGWNFYSRVLLVLGYYLSGNEDSAINELENFTRYLHGKDLNERQKFQRKVLSHLIEGKEKGDLEFNGKLDWDPTSSEIIDFNEYIVGHL
ncbi:hypothetical protein HZ996_09690 [Cryomorphaceae bacterium]|nr:hypothetical protein HZ996_09690 [Cryomorphaceae bacterium]